MLCNQRPHGLNSNFIFQVTSTFLKLFENINHQELSHGRHNKCHCIKNIMHLCHSTLAMIRIKVYILYIVMLNKSNLNNYFNICVYFPCVCPITSFNSNRQITKVSVILITKNLYLPMYF